nr:MAG TPA: hypothetical protein [Bacteriophage sp.]
MHHNYAHGYAYPKAASCRLSLNNGYADPWAFFINNHNEKRQQLLTCKGCRIGR